MLTMSQNTKRPTQSTKKGQLIRDRWLGVLANQPPPPHPPHPPLPPQPPLPPPAMLEFDEGVRAANVAIKHKKKGRITRVCKV